MIVAISLTEEEQELLLTDPYYMPGAESALWSSIAGKVRKSRAEEWDPGKIGKACDGENNPDMIQE